MDLTKAQSQQMRDLLADILAAAQHIEWHTGDSDLQLKAEFISATVIKLSAMLPAVQGKERDGE